MLWKGRRQTAVNSHSERVFQDVVELEGRRWRGGRTHVVLVFGHGCYGVFVTAKLHVGFTGRLAVHCHVNVDPQRIQGREELQTQPLKT